MSDDVDPWQLWLAEGIVPPDVDLIPKTRWRADDGTARVIEWAVILEDDSEVPISDDTLSEWAESVTIRTEGCTCRLLRVGVRYLGVGGGGCIMQPGHTDLDCPVRMGGGQAVD